MFPRLEREERLSLNNGKLNYRNLHFKANSKRGRLD